MGLVYTCGDSYATPDPRVPGTHYSELVSEQLGHELKIVSMPGCGSKFMNLQIDEARNNNADLVLIHKQPGRLEIQYGEDLDEPDAPISLKNFYYGLNSNVNGLREKNTSKSFMLATNVLTIANPEGRTRISKTLKSHTIDGSDYVLLKDIDSFFDGIEPIQLMNMFNPKYEAYKETLMFYASLDKLHNEGIPFVFINESHENIGNPRLNKKYFLDYEIVYDNPCPVIYHTFEEKQKIIANKIMDVL